MTPARPRDPALALVVLAAGASSRLGECKALVDLSGQTPLARLLEAGAPIGGARPLVISGADRARIEPAVPASAEHAWNERWSDGRTTSIALACRVRAGFDLCIAPVDVPLVPRAVFDALARAWREAGAPARGWLAPFRVDRTRAGTPRRFGHPLILGRELAARVDELGDDRPLSELRTHARPLLALEVEDPSILDDLDTPADLERLRARG